MNWQEATLDYQPKNATNERTGDWQDWGKGSTQFVLSCLSVWASVNLFYWWHLNQRIHGFISSWPAVWKYCSTVSFLDKIHLLRIPDWQWGCVSPPYRGTAILRQCISLFKVFLYWDLILAALKKKQVTIFQIPVPENILILWLMIIIAVILSKMRLYCWYKLTPDVYGNNLSLVGWLWHLMFHVHTCF